MLIGWFFGDRGPTEALVIVLLALAIDMAIGDPPWLYRAVPHPVALLGRAIEAAERRLNDAAVGRKAQLQRGAFLLGALVLGALLVALTLAAGLRVLPGGGVLEAIFASSLFAFRGLYEHVRAVAAGLAHGLDKGRAAVCHIVGRDPESLDEAGVARAAIESTAENFSDGVVAPAFWFALLGLPGLFAYKAINTLDSMIGYRSSRHEAFGMAAARVDTWANWAPARLAGLLFVLAGFLLPGGSARRAWQTMLRDAPKHRSANAGWQEAAVAGALGFALAGPRRYREQVVDDHWMGNGRRDLGPEDIRRALDLYIAAGMLLAVLLAAAALLA